MKRLQGAARRSTAMLPRTSDGQNGAVAVRGNEYMRLLVEGVDAALDCRGGVCCLLVLQEVAAPFDDGRGGPARHVRSRSLNVRLRRR